MAKKIMIQGTMSNVGKSFLVAALCRIFRQDGYRTAPFKSQNMALNSYITSEGLEIGRAQAMQAEAAGIEPSADMNPILLKPTSQMGSQVIVNGEVLGNMKAMEYYRRKTEFLPAIRGAFARLEEQYEVIVIEGAGSPAEINLRDHDIVNMGLAQLVDAPVLLAGDIDRGGVFASLYGTVALLEPEERARIRGLVINKFRGDRKILEPGLRMIEERLGIPVVGVVPMEAMDLDDEDSLAERLACREEEREGTVSPDRLRIAVIRLPHISNFTDFNVLERQPGVEFRYVERRSGLGRPDLVILPGTKNTMADLRWLRESGLEGAILRLLDEGNTSLIGICGGYQMLGEWLRDPEGVEGKPGAVMRGMGLLEAETVFQPEKTRTRTGGTLDGESLFFPAGREKEEGLAVSGYEIHMGLTTLRQGNTSCRWRICLSGGRQDGLERADGRVFGTYLHGIFDNEALTRALLCRLADLRGLKMGIMTEGESFAEYKERQYDRLADLVRSSLDMKKIYEILEESDV